MLPQQNYNSHSSTNTPPVFDYNTAFSRNLGWFTSEEQNIIRQKRIAIVGLGGVGGNHLMSFIRTGFSRFKIADFDEFALENFNRQVGSDIETIGHPKIDVLKKSALLLNPDSKIECYNRGIDQDNIESFLEDVDILIDGLDVFVLDLRIQLYEKAHQLGIPVVTAGPFGAGTALMAFHPKGMS
ncbi:MAG: ThiF family adenylyltransferase, partial [Bdellovibrionales bacterium]|nr:ThiF family adenylyltransferase [Bdellovibrionales bacterium]